VDADYEDSFEIGLGGDEEWDVAREEERRGRGRGGEKKGEDANGTTARKHGR
jgi:hypothetical protein